METFVSLPAVCVGNSLVTGEFFSQRPVTRSFDVFFDLRLVWVNNGETGDLRRHHAHYDIIVVAFGMTPSCPKKLHKIVDSQWNSRGSGYNFIGVTLPAYGQAPLVYGTETWKGFYV